MYLSFLVNVKSRCPLNKEKCKKVYIWLQGKVKPEDPFHSLSYGHYAVVSYWSLNVLNFFIQTVLQLVLNFMYCSHM